MKKQGAAALLAGLVALGLIGCGGAGPAETSASDAGAPSPTAIARTSAPTPRPTPTPDGPAMFKLGEAVTLPSASITVLSAEKADSIERAYDGPLTPTSDGTLWLLKMNWTNLSTQAVSKVCWGPYEVDMSVYDTQGREMLLDDGSGGISGNECSNGLMTGQSGDWYAAYQGLADSQIGYAVLADYNAAEPVAIAFVDGLTLTFGN